VLPLFPPLALLCGRWLSIARDGRPFTARRALSFAAAAAAILVAGRIAAPSTGGLLKILGPDPRPVAAAIAADAAASSPGAAQVFYLSSKGFPGCGLAFYLRSPVEPLDAGGPVEDDDPEGFLSPRNLRCVLEEELPPGTIQYFAVAERKLARFQQAAGSDAPGRWLIEEGPVRVWRRAEP
jgi:hypothetical protein